MDYTDKEKQVSRKKSNKTEQQAAARAPWLAKMLRSLPDCIDEGIYCLDASGRFIFVNSSILERSGIPLEQIYMSHFLEVIQPQDHRKAKENFENVMSGRNGAPYELSYKRPDGQTHMIEVHSRPIRDNGKIVGLLGIARNITGRKMAEDALKLSEINLSRLVKEMTAEFLEKSAELAMQIEEHKRTEAAQRKKIEELKAALNGRSDKQDAPSNPTGRPDVKKTATS